MRNKLLVAFKEQYLLNHQTLGSTCYKCQMPNSVQNDIQFFFLIIMPVLKMCPALSVPQGGGGGGVTCIQNTCIQNVSNFSAFKSDSRKFINISIILCYINR